ncbi:MAG TPA: hypothetical protein VJP85_04585, partial [Candidatus Baltobacteraceae bacterium]|nr:hypothetical protein [Candidatus Baltobacteraceae bacterium]
MLAAALAVAFIVTGCGGGQKTSSTTNTTKSVPVASPAPGGVGQSGYGGTGAAVPSNLHCGAVAPVWANTRTHVYHVSSDPLYGRTKHGEFMCPQTAASQGYHKAGGGSSSGTMMKSKHHRRSGGG